MKMKPPFYDLGDGTAVPKSKVVLILDAESATRSAVTKKFLRRQSRKGDSVPPKKALRQVNSLILANAYGKDSLYSSSRSAKALSKGEVPE